MWVISKFEPRILFQIPFAVFLNNILLKTGWLVLMRKKCELLLPCYEGKRFALIDQLVRSTGCQLVGMYQSIFRTLIFHLSYFSIFSSFVLFSKPLQLHCQHCFRKILRFNFQMLEMSSSKLIYIHTYICNTYEYASNMRKWIAIRIHLTKALLQVLLTFHLKFN